MPMLCRLRSSPTGPANLSDCLKQFSLLARQYQHTCNMAMNCLLAGRLAFRVDPSLIDDSWDNLGWWVHGRIPSQLIHIPNWSTSWLNNDNAFHKGCGGVQPKASFKHAQNAHRMHS